MNFFKQKNCGKMDKIEEKNWIIFLQELKNF